MCQPTRAVFVPGTYKLLRSIKTPKFAAVPFATLIATTAGGLLLMLFLGGMGGGFDTASFPDIPTHPMAVEKLNACPQATALLDKPIRMTAAGKGSYQTRGAFGTSSWNLDLAGPHKTGKAVYAMEMHGGKWGFTSLAIEIDGKQTDLAGCMTPV